MHQALRTVGDMDTCTSVLWLSDSAMAATEWSRFTPCGYDVGVEVIGTSGTVTLRQITASRSEVVVGRLLARTGTAAVRSLRGCVPLPPSRAFSLPCGTVDRPSPVSRTHVERSTWL